MERQISEIWASCDNNRRRIWPLVHVLSGTHSQDRKSPENVSKSGKTCRIRPGSFQHTRPPPAFSGVSGARPGTQYTAVSLCTAHPKSFSSWFKIASIRLMKSPQLRCRLWGAFLRVWRDWRYVSHSTQEEKRCTAVWSIHSVCVPKLILQPWMRRRTASTAT